MSSSRGGEALIKFVYKPWPEGIDSYNSVVSEAAIASLPLSAFLLVLVAWTLSSLCGAFTTAAISRGPRVLLASVISGLFWCATLLNLLTIPGPGMMWWGLILIPLGCLVGITLALRLNPPTRSGPQPFDMRKKNMACK